MPLTAQQFIGLTSEEGNRLAAGRYHTLMIMDNLTNTTILERLGGRNPNIDPEDFNLPHCFVFATVNQETGRINQVRMRDMPEHLE